MDRPCVSKKIRAEIASEILRYHGKLYYFILYFIF